MKLYSLKVVATAILPTHAIILIILVLQLPFYWPYLPWSERKSIRTISLVLR